MRKITTEEFIRRAKAVHGDLYDYSESIYMDARSPIAIKCRIHGIFYTSPDNHVNKGTGCPYCAGNIRKYTTEEFILESKRIYGDDRFSYQNTIYVNNHTDVIITCPIHGDFSIDPKTFLSTNMKMKEPCPYCDLYHEVDTNKFIQKARQVHGDKYIYDKVIYTGNRNHVIITCPIHGDFYQRPHEHLLGHGCYSCCNSGIFLGTEEFIRRAHQVHGDRYGYDKVTYVNNSTPVIITCPIHGDFYQRPNNHLLGKGCQECSKSRSILEETMIKYMNSQGIYYIPQMSWEWLVHKNKQTVDFYVPDYNIAIECQGIQHFKEVDFFESGRDNFEQRLKRDENKQRLCLEHGILIYYFSNLSKGGLPFNYPYLVFEDPFQLFEVAANNGTLLI